jgi:hypothetical protein
MDTFRPCFDISTIVNDYFGCSTVDNIVAFRAKGEKNGGKSDVEQQWGYGAMNPNQRYDGLRIGGPGFNLKPNHENIVFIKVYNRQFHVINALGADSVLQTYPAKIRQLKAKLNKLTEILSHYKGNFIIIIKFNSIGS